MVEQMANNDQQFYCPIGVMLVYRVNNAVFCSKRVKRASFILVVIGTYDYSINH